MSGTASILNYNLNANEITAAAGRISTLAGSADEIYEKSCQKGDEANVKLIHKILSSGHESVLEHISLNISFDNVSVFVEQFMIEFRLASFTVKSRRYVDFGKMGYVRPDFFCSECEEELRDRYTGHMEYLFGEYNAFLKEGIPKEDARFVLPYSFCSNFYCTVNARELIKIMNEMIWGRGSSFPELVKLGESLFSQCREKLPYLCVQKIKRGQKNEIKDYLTADPGFLTGQTAKSPVQLSCDSFPGGKTGADGAKTALLNGPLNPEKLICQAAAFSAGVSCFDSERDLDVQTQKRVIKTVMEQPRRRELEQVNFTILFRRISLAGLTHLVRHRMQSIVIPVLTNACDFSDYIVPQSVVQAGLSERYAQIFAKSGQVWEKLISQGFALENKAYLLLSGMTVSVMTTMNANELLTFFCLRTCNRAQWEIKACADELLEILRKNYPVLFSMYGPSCFVRGKCPEGKMTCGKMEETMLLFTPPISHCEM